MLENIFKKIIIADAIILIISFFLPFFDSSVESESEIIPDFLLILALLLAVLYFVNLYLLYKFKPLGKSIYLPILFLSFGLTFSLPLEAPANHFSMLLEQVSPILSGMIIVFIYFTEIKNKFVIDEKLK